MKLAGKTDIGNCCRENQDNYRAAACRTTRSGQWYATEWAEQRWPGRPGGHRRARSCLPPPCQTCQGQERLFFC